MATNISSWETQILPDIMGVPYPALEIAVRNACIAFCEQTLLWTYTLDRITVAVDTQSYPLTIPGATYGEIISVDDVKYKQDGEDDDQFTTLDPISKNQKDLHDSGSWPFRTSTTPSGYWVDKDKNILLYNTPTAASSEGLLVRCNLKPTKTCTTVEDFLYKDHFEVIGAGAKAKLFSRKAQSWYDPDLAGVFGSIFNVGINDAKPIKTTGYTKRPMKVRMREWL
ncbi:hypothetical protein KAX97_14115 [candidate division WOR-3 bacterium]|nr:hypothetical protein [candidate division WOR-3 bacterium]